MKSSRLDEWGTPMPLRHRSNADIPEKDFVARVFRDPYYPEMLLNIKGIESQSELLPEVELREYRRRLSGDVDVLVVPPGAPEKATAVQVKRFPIKLDEMGRAHALANSLEELFAKGVEQANYTADIGFSQVYLWIFVAIDSRAPNAGRFTYDGAGPALQSRIDSAMSLGLADRPGSTILRRRRRESQAPRAKCVSTQRADGVDATARRKQPQKTLTRHPHHARFPATFPCAPPCAPPASCRPSPGASG